MNELGDAALNQISTYLDKINEGKYKAKLQVGKADNALYIGRSWSIGRTNIQSSKAAFQNILSSSQASSNKNLIELKERVSKLKKDLLHDQGMNHSLLARIYFLFSGHTGAKKQLDQLEESLEFVAYDHKSLIKGESFHVFEKNPEIPLRGRKYNNLKISVRYDLVKENPLLVLDSLKIALTNSKVPPEKMEIEYLHPDGKAQEGVDKGGLSQDFFSRLISGSAEKLLKHRTIPELKNPEDNARWETLAKLVDLATKGDKEYSKVSYPIGPAFNPKFFQLLEMAFKMKNVKSDKKDTLENKNEKLKELTCDLCFSLTELEESETKLFKLLLKNPEKLNDEEIKDIWGFTSYITNMDEYSDNEVPGYSEQLANAEIPLEKVPSDSTILHKFKNEIINKAKIDNQELINKFKKILLDPSVKEQVRAMSTFAEALTSQFLSGMNAEQLENKIQGRSYTNEAVESALFFNKEVKTEHSEWMRQWIRESSPEMIKQFVIATTSGPALQQIKIHMAAKPEVGERNPKKPDDLFFSTCGKSLTIDFSQFANYESFKERLDQKVPLAQGFHVK